MSAAPWGSWERTTVPSWWWSPSSAAWPAPRRCVGMVRRSCSTNVASQPTTGVCPHPDTWGRDDPAQLRWSMLALSVLSALLAFRGDGWRHGWGSGGWGWLWGPIGLLGGVAVIATVGWFWVRSARPGARSGVDRARG